MGEIIFIVVALVVVLGIGAYFAKKRAAAMQKAAIEMGFTFERQGRPFLAGLDKNLHLLRQGSVKSLSNVMRGPDGVIIFDYQFQRTGVNIYNSRATKQTVCAFHFPSTALPVFSMGPERVWQKAASALGYQLIRFDTHPAFSKRFALRGSDENAVRLFFTPPLVEYCQSWPEKPAWCLEAAGPWLLLYQPSKSVKPLDLRTFADTTQSMFKEIRNRANLPATA